MKLGEYLDCHGLTHTAFAAQIGVSVQTVWRYAQGTRHPRPAIMRRIIEVTDGQVRPQDFLDQQSGRAA